MRRSNSTQLVFSYFLLVAFVGSFLDLGNRLAVEAKVYTEGGSFRHQADELESGFDTAEDDATINLVNPYDSSSGYSSPDSERQLEGIVDELAQLRHNPEEQSDEIAGEDDEEPQLRYPQRNPSEAEIEELRNLGRKFKELREQEAEVEEQPIKHATPSHQRKKEKTLQPPQKKGESEYVDFIAPKVVVSKQMKNREHMEKRVSEYSVHREDRRWNKLLSSSSNLVFMAFVTMCCVMTVLGVVGGAYYYKHVRSVREDPFDDFTRYSPAGPAKQLKKGKGSGNFTAEKGDETLAYRAQLHHYQQTKQKIIGAGSGGAEQDTSDKSDDEADLEHNFSVYECPGLAPTGDIEVQNPNFVDSGVKAHK